MCFVRKAGIGLLLACAPITGAGCSSLPSKLSAIPLVARPRSTDDQYRAALQSEQKLDFIRARDQYAALQQRSPQNAAYAHRMGVVCTQLGDHATAKKYFDRARQLEPSNAPLLTDMGYSAIVQKEYARAEELLEEAVRIRPENSRAVNNLALAIGYQGRFDESLAAFRKINSESQSLANLAYIHAQRHEPERAIDCYRRAVALDPNNKAAAASLAQLDTSNHHAVTPLASGTAPGSVAVDEPRRPNPPASSESPPHASEFESPLVQKLSSSRSFPKTTAARPRDRLTDEDEVPFFESGELSARSNPAARTAVGDEAEFEKPLIVPDELLGAPVASVNETSHVADVPETTWKSDFDSPIQPLPPHPLIDEPADELAHVFADDDNLRETNAAESEDLTGLEWAQEQQATLAATASSQPETGFSGPADGLKGFCPVAIRDERRLTPTFDQFSCEHQAQTYRFCSAEALEKFQANPALYTPVAGGLDIVAVRQGSAVANGMLDFAVWYRNRLHLFSSSENLAAFRAAPRTFASVP